MYEVVVDTLSYNVVLRVRHRSVASFPGRRSKRHRHSKDNRCLLGCLFFWLLLQYLSFSFGIAKNLHLQHCQIMLLATKQTSQCAATCFIVPAILQKRVHARWLALNKQSRVTGARACMLIDFDKPSMSVNHFMHSRHAHARCVYAFRSGRWVRWRNEVKWDGPPCSSM